ncbi:hypothetical protein [Streptomyces sp. NPDC046862]
MDPVLPCAEDATEITGGTNKNQQNQQNPLTVSYSAGKGRMDADGAS